MSAEKADEKIKNLPLEPDVNTVLDDYCRSKGVKKIRFGNELLRSALRQRRLMPAEDAEQAVAG